MSLVETEYTNLRFQYITHKALPPWGIPEGHVS